MSEDKIKIAVHNGNFHADDCVAYCIISAIYPDNELVRTRTPEVLEQCKFRLDVGGRYNGETDFDHHQRDFMEARTDNDKIKYASAGLVWKHFGEEYIKAKSKELSAEQITFIKNEIDYTFIRYVDANDNGINIVSEEIPSFSKIIFLFNYRFGYINNFGFIRGATLAADIIDGMIEQLTKYLESEKVVMQALEENGNKPILILPQKVAFQDVINRHWDQFINIQLAVYPETNCEKWRIKSLNDDPKDRFSNRCKAPEAWRGIMDSELEKVTGIADVDFVHPNGFTGGAKNKDAAIQMAQKWCEIVSCQQNS